MPEPIQNPTPNSQPNGGGNGGAPGGEPNPKPNTNPDPSTMTPDQLTAALNDPKVLENSALWNHPRIKELRDGAAKAKQLEQAQNDAATKKLEDDKKWEELAGKHKGDLEGANKTITSLRQDQALTNELVKVGVKDLDAALKLIDRSKLTTDDASGKVTGVDEAIAALKTDKDYLFTQGGGATTVGASTNPGAPGTQTPGGTQFKFKRSQLADPTFYAANRKEIVEAMQKGLIEDDLK